MTTMQFIAIADQNVAGGGNRRLTFDPAADVYNPSGWSFADSDRCIAVPLSTPVRVTLDLLIDDGTHDPAGKSFRAFLTTQSGGGTITEPLIGGNIGAAIFAGTGGASFGGRSAGNQLFVGVAVYINGPTTEQYRVAAKVQIESFPSSAPW